MQTTDSQKTEPKQRMTLLFPVSLYKQVKKEAIDRQISLSQYFINLAKK
tara:strand:+ start:51 stop:197 length:147 start_codon:yes stop_codon:yes gene_type:complete